MKRPITYRQFVLISLVVVLMVFTVPETGYAQVPVPAVQESITVSTASPLTEATLDGSEVTVTLAGRTFERSIFSIRRAVSVSGIAGVSVGTFGITRASDTRLTIELDFNGDFDEDGTLTFTVGAGAIASYNGAALTRDVAVAALEETVEASTASPLTEATLDGSVVTLTLAGRAFESSIFDVRDGVSVSGIAGVSVGTFGVRRVSDSRVTVELDFNGDFDEEGTLTFTVGAAAIESYNGSALTAQLTVSAGMESVTATTASTLTESTLDGSVVTLTLSGRSYESSIFDVRDGVSVSGIAGVSVGTFGIQRKSDAVVTVELSFNGDIDGDGTLTFTVGADAIESYNGAALTAQLSVTAGMESVTATTASTLTESTLDGSVVTLTLTGGRYEFSTHDVRDGVTVSGITGVSVDEQRVHRASDTKVTVELSFNGDIDSDGTLTFTVGADAIANYSGSALTDQVSVTALEETVVATTPQSLTEATLNGSVVTLTLSGRAYVSSTHDVRDGVTVSGITGVSVDEQRVHRAGDTKVTVELSFNGNMDTDGTLTFTVGADAIANFNGDPLTATLPVTAETGGGTNQVPTFSAGASTTRSFAENTPAGQNIGSPVTATDSDGGTLTYSLEGTDAGSFALVPATGQLQTRSGVVYDYEVKNRYEVTVRVSDGQGGSATIAVTINLTDVSEPQAMPQLYWNHVNYRIQSANLDGSNVRDVLVTGPSGQSSSWGLAVDVGNGKLYWTDWIAETIRRADLDGTNVEDLVTSADGLDRPVALALDLGNGKMYWTDWDTDKIQRADLDGTNVEDLVTSGLVSPGGLALDVTNGKMYWTDGENDKIQRADLDGTNVEDLVTSGLGRPSGLALDVPNGKMYWTDRQTSRIQRADVGGTNVEDLVTSGVAEPVALALDLGNGKMYWTDWTADKIQRADLDGTNVEDLVTSADGLDRPFWLALAVPVPVPAPPPATQMYWNHVNYKIQSASLDGSNVRDVLITGPSGQSGSWGLAVDVRNGKLYWTDWVAERIRRANLDGTNVEDLVTSADGLDRPVALALDVRNGKMYWTDWDTDKIQRADLDGTNVEDLVTSGLVSPGGLALDVPNGKMYWTDGENDKIQRADLDGTNVEDLVTSGLGRPSGLALDVPNGKMYWTDRQTSRIQRADVGGTNVEDLVTSGVAEPVALALDLGNGKMYWTDWTADKIQRADLDGTNVEDLVTSADGLDRPFWLVLTVADATRPPAPPGQKTADFNGDGIVNFADFFEFVDAFGT